MATFTPVTGPQPATVKPVLTDVQILENMKVTAPWLFKMYKSPGMTDAQKATFIKWGRMSAAGTPPTEQQIAADTYSWDQTQIWSANQAAMFRLSFTNPGEYAQKQKKAQDEIARLIQEKGLNPDQETIDEAVNESFLQGWGSGDPRILDLLVKKSNFDTTKHLSGTAGLAQDSFMQIANNYGILLPKDPVQLQQFIKESMGVNGIQGFQQYAKEQAKLIYPWMSAYIDAGGTPKSYLQPIATQIANTLDIAPDAINWQDPKWQSLVTKPDPRQPGMNLPATLSDITTKIKTDVQYGYDNTTAAKRDAYTIGAQIAQRFGNRAAG